MVGGRSEGQPILRSPDRPIDHPITRSPDHPTLPVVLSVLVLFAVSCGKRGDPQPPFPRGPRAITDLKIEQEAADAVLTFTYPDRLLDGSPLTDLASVEVYRLPNPPASIAAPRTAAGPRPSAPRTDQAPAAGARREAVTARQAEESFYSQATLAGTLSVGEIARRTRGASIVFTDPLPPILAKVRPLSSLAYAVVSVRRGGPGGRHGERSPLSNIVILAPEVPPAAPTLLAITPEEGRICIEWLAPSTDLLGGAPAKVGGYFVYRRALPEEDYGEPINGKAVSGTSLVDTTAPYGAKLVYAVRGTLPDKPRIEGPPSDEGVVDYRDVFPPPAPPRLDALSEASLVRLVWDPVGAPDLAGYAVFRSEDGQSPVRLNAELVADATYSDTTVKPGHRYVYMVRAVDRSGNVSVPSPPARGEPF